MAKTRKVTSDPSLKSENLRGTFLHRDGVYLKFWNRLIREHQKLPGIPMRCHPSDEEYDYSERLTEIKRLAKLANAEIDRQIYGVRINRYQFSNTIQLYRPIAMERYAGHLAQQACRRRLDKIDATFGKRNPNLIETHELDTWIEPLPYNAHKMMRYELKEVFQFAMSKGHREAVRLNPAANLIGMKRPQVIRKRLSKEHFDQIAAVAPPYLYTAMWLMLHTTLRPNDIVQIKFEDLKDQFLRTKVRKTSKFLELELNEKAAQIIHNARLSGIDSPYVVHRIPGRVVNQALDKFHWTQLTRDYLSREFTRITRALKLFDDLQPNERPTIYEIRSLSGRLYRKEGWTKDEIKDLYAHTENETTEIYLDERAHAVYTRVKAGLNL